MARRLRTNWEYHEQKRKELRKKTFNDLFADMESAFDLEFRMIENNKQMILWAADVGELPEGKHKRMISRYGSYGMFSYPGGYDDMMGFDDFVGELDYVEISKTNLDNLISNAWAYQPHNFKSDIGKILDMSFNKICNGETVAFGGTISNVIRLNDDWCSFVLYTGNPF